MTVCGACAVDMLLDRQPWITWLLTSGVDLNEAIIDYDKYLRVIKRQVKTELPFPVTRSAEHVPAGTVCDKCLTFFLPDTNNPPPDLSEFKALGLFQDWQTRHAEATGDPSAMERHHLEMLNAARTLSWLYVELVETYGEDTEAEQLIGEVREALGLVVRAGLRHLNDDKGRLDGGTLDRAYRECADAARIDHHNF